MGSPLSCDLRERIVEAVNTAKHSLRELAGFFCVNLTTIVRLLQRVRQTGSVAPKPHGGGRPRKLDADADKRLLKLVEQAPDATLTELRDRLRAPCSIMAVFRALKRNHITRKKKTLFADERDSPAVRQQRQAFFDKMSTIDVNRLVFVDETGATTAMSRPYGRAPIGERVEATVPGAWKTVTLISGLRTSGVSACLAFPGSTDRLAFDTYVEKMLVPELHKGDVVIWDNLSSHKSKKAIAAVESAEARVEPLPTYSPDLTPIEEMFSKLKSGLKRLASRTVGAVMDAMGTVLNQVTPSDIQGWFGDRCPYATQS